MRRMSDVLLNGLLGALVVSSILLSSQVWFPSEPKGIATPKEARVQTPPPATEQRMPDLFRPERILVRRPDGMVASLQADSVPYRLAWFRSRTVFERHLSLVGPVVVGPTELPSLNDAVSVTLLLPSSVEAGYWGALWKWDTDNWHNASANVDRLIFYLGESAAMYLEGPDGRHYRLGTLTQDDRKLLSDLTRDLDEKDFAPYRPVDGKELTSQVQPGVLVPQVDSVPHATISVKLPDDSAEAVRFFPDLSVVRQIDEKDAKTFTDGRRLLRISASGLLEFRSVDSTGVAPDLQRTLQVAREWVGNRLGWPQELVLNRYDSKPGKVRLTLDYRTDGPFPVESTGGAMVLDVAADGIAYFKRYPEIESMQFRRDQMQPIISPEEALNRAGSEVTLLLFESVRDMHLAYQIRPPARASDANWTVIPVWVLRIGEARVYVPAAADLEQHLPIMVQR